MDWPNEPWRKLYVRATPDWLSWPWQSRALMPLLIMRCDASGQIGLGRAGVAGLSELVKLPLEVVEPGLEGLVDDGCVTLTTLKLLDTTVTARHTSSQLVTGSGQLLTIENFVEAQEARSSDKLRQQNVRDRRKSMKSQGTTVTRRHSSSRIEENRRDQIRKDSLAAPAAPRAADGVLAYWAEKRGKPPKFGRGDYSVVNLALQTFSPEELRAAVDGVGHDPWRERALHDGVGNVFGDADQVRKFIQLSGLTTGQADQLRRRMNGNGTYFNPEGT